MNDNTALAQLRDHFLSRLGRLGVIDDDTQLHAYSCDGLTGWRAVPGLVVLPTNTAEVALVVKGCYDLGVPFVARGSVRDYLVEPYQLPMEC